MINTKRERMLVTLTVVVLCLAIIILSFLYLSPRWSERADAIADYEQAEGQLQQIEGVYQEVEQERERQDGRYSDDLRKLPPAPMTEVWVMDLLRAESLANVYMTEANFSQQEREEGDESAIQRQQVNMQVQATSDASLQRFFDELDRLPRLVNIEEVYYQGTDTDTQIDGVAPKNFNVTVTSYYIPNEMLHEQIRDSSMTIEGSTDIDAFFQGEPMS
ncbi:hypothetical protein [Texcoconibacillus texcoconensis]|uniref:Type II secretory pathway pseudopilin PulG n=1 Tax=Texcoconibacillus texcoconensis TaxID=1095777 RepID=A0A840QSB0_9BACI|nr:hypothetical protein [Texcoconibacillus texcoconensis]MBB5174392.1 type II secretory pathway pseudopilin PulG [Texcoconibacillus texcoconensis]